MKNYTKNGSLIVTFAFALVAFFHFTNEVYGQFNILDGDNCRPDGTPEWTGSTALSDSDPASLTAPSNLLNYWGSVVDTNFVMSFEREGKGNIFLAIYLNTDCDATNNDISKSGADAALLFSVSSGLIQDFNIYEWQSSSSSYAASGNFFTGFLGNSVCADSSTSERFIEMSMPISSIFDICSANLATACGSFTVTEASTHSGGSANSSLRDAFVIDASYEINLPPVADFSATDSVACFGESIELNGMLSLSGVNGNETGDLITSYQWDTDYNGSTISIDATGVNHTITLNSSGAHEVALIVTDGFGCKDTSISEIDVQVRPEAVGTMLFNTIGTSQVCIEAVYDGNSSVDNHGANNLIYSWDFGDGSTSTSVSGTHDYVNCNNYNSVLTVTDPDNNLKCASDSISWISPLPVEFMFFGARLNEDNLVQLDWSTASEQNNKGFYVLKSTNGTEWEQVHFEEGNGNSINVLNYKWVDRNVSRVKTYYKLMQQDYNGETMFSDVVSIEGVNKNSLSLYPNPAKSTLNINVKDAESEQILSYIIYNSHGKQVKSATVNSMTSTSSVSLDGLPSGTYVIQIKVNGNVEMLSFSKI